MKRLIVFLAVIGLLVLVAVPPSFAFRDHRSYGGNYHRGSYNRGGGNFWPGVVAGAIAGTVLYPRYIAPPPVYVAPPVPYYRDSYDRAYELEMERLRQEEYRERQRLQAERERLRQEQAREDARRDFYGHRR